MNELNKTDSEELKKYFQTIKNIEKGHIIEPIDVDLIGIRPSLMKNIKTKANERVYKITKISLKLEKRHLNLVYSHLKFYNIETNSFTFTFVNNLQGFVNNLFDEEMLKFLVFFINLTLERITLKVSKDIYYSSINSLAKKVKTQKQIVFEVGVNGCDMLVNNDKTSNRTILSCSKERRVDMVKFSRGYFLEFYENCFKCLKKLQIDVLNFDDITKFLTNRELNQIELTIIFRHFNEKSFISLQQKRIVYCKIVELRILEMHFRQPNVNEIFKIGVTAALINKSKIRYARRKKRKNGQYDFIDKVSHFVFSN